MTSRGPGHPEIRRCKKSSISVDARHNLRGVLKGWRKFGQKCRFPTGNACFCKKCVSHAFLMGSEKSHLPPYLRSPHRKTKFVYKHSPRNDTDHDEWQLRLMSCMVSEPCIYGRIWKRTIPIVFHTLYGSLIKTPAISFWSLMVWKRSLVFCLCSMATCCLAHGRRANILFETKREIASAEIGFETKRSF